ncbi:COX15/CtaA family protein [Paucibacter sp. APW11]|uniref:COX15/CtaA family protein n=1 Tax=Roseateles aquae TaxID=3077235 RepID=A0ABU3PF27_9BURK|nr:COX15/CtaA family protein [Paucibacter sp. APW11]MDT9001217.1 COX15/CtaA family protein [Paucibacter sp. APW11]
MSGFDFSPVLRLLMLGSALGCLPFLWALWRHRQASPSARLRALTLLTLFLTFDLVLFGAFTRLTDSGLGCPDWPGCYGSASPLGASEEIHAAQTALPSGPVTHGKAWVEMIHRYLASGVGFLILMLCVMSWRYRARVAEQIGHAAPSPWWSVLTLVWVCVQGAFGALTVTMKLFPLIVSLHLLLAFGLLMLLAWQAEAYRSRTSPPLLQWPASLRRGAWLLLALSLGQAALGAWVSTNYAVLACAEFPLCQGQWWPATDFDHGFALWRELGRGHDGQWLSHAALTAIHLTHRVGALLVFTALIAYAVLLRRQGGEAGRRWATRLLLVALWQFLSGLSNVVLGWPMIAALAHTGGAAALLLMLSFMLARLQRHDSSELSFPPPQGLSPGAVS